MRLRLSSLCCVVAVLLLPAGAVDAQPGPAAGIAFHSNRDGNNNIYVMNPDGSGQARITMDSSNNQRADLSPDGTRIVFSSNRSAGVATHFKIFVMDADGSN